MSDKCQYLIRHNDGSSRLGDRNRCGKMVDGVMVAVKQVQKASADEAVGVSGQFLL